MLYGVYDTHTAYRHVVLRMVRGSLCNIREASDMLLVQGNGLCRQLQMSVCMAEGA